MVWDHGSTGKEEEKGRSWYYQKDDLALVVVLIAAPAWGAPAITLTDEGGGVVATGYDSTGVGIIDLGTEVSAFAADMTGDPDMEAYLGDLGLSDIVSALYYEAIHVSATPMDIPDGALVFGATITGVDEGVAAAHLVDMSAGLIVASQDITVIPEPMTIAFLGLGGLFLRRRK